MSQGLLFRDAAAPEEVLPVAEGRRLDLEALPARSALTPQSGGARRWFDWSGNPYRGCEFGCSYPASFTTPPRLSAPGTPSPGPKPLRDWRESPARLRAEICRIWSTQEPVSRRPARSCRRVSQAVLGVHADARDGVVNDPGYCYARYSHEWLGHDDPRAFQDRIYVKRGFAEALRNDLRTKVRPGDHIAFGTATDPYQPLEKRERVMRAALREFTGVRGLRVSITTKSSLVSRDIDLLIRIARHNSVQVNFTITTPDRRLARVLEPRAPAPGLRFGALRRVRKAGIDAGVFLMPLLPGVTDAMPDLVQLFRAARDSGASFVVPAVVFLCEPSRSYFLEDLHLHYPRVAARYEVWARTKPQLPASIREEVLSRVDWLARRFHVPTVCADHPPEPARPSRQTTFAFA